MHVRACLSDKQSSVVNAEKARVSPPRASIQDTLQNTRQGRQATVSISHSSFPSCLEPIYTLCYSYRTNSSAIVVCKHTTVSAYILYLDMPNHLQWALLASLLGGASAAGLYTKSSPVLQVDAKNFNSLINKSNHTSVCNLYSLSSGAIANE